MAKQPRDMTERQFLAALKRGGFGNVGPMGYVRLPAPCENTAVSIINAGDRYRDQIAYLHRQYDRCLAEHDRDLEEESLNDRGWQDEGSGIPGGPGYSEEDMRRAFDEIERRVQCSRRKRGS